MESQNSAMLTSTEEDDPNLLETVKEIVEKVEDPDIEVGEYFLVPDVQQEPEVEEVQLVVERDESPSISQMCRICARTDEHLIPIFKEEGLEHDLCSKIHKHLPIKVSENDTLPLQLCYQCAATLLAWNELSESCLDAERQLLRLQEQEHQNKQSSAYREEENIDQVEDNVIDDKLERKKVSEDHQKPDCLKDNEVKNTETSDFERSSRVQTSFKVFLDTQNIFWRRRNNLTDKYSGNSSIDPDPIWIDPTASLDDLNDEQLKQEDQHHEEFQISEIIANSDSDEFTWNCKICSCEFDSLNELNDHSKIHNSTQSYQCIECGRCFKLKDSYLRHARIHKDERPFTCHVCGKQFRDSGGLSRHLKDVHAKLKKFPCDLCGGSFASKATRDDHRRTHTGERPYVCDCCGKTFKSKASLYIHSKLHTNEFPHPCSYCTKKFRRRQEMLAHVTTHTGEKNYACDMCTKRFRVKSELMRHRLIHSDDKPFVCTKCGLAFRQKRYLNNHLKSRHIETMRNC